ncbi:MAG: MFS transporter [Lactobacillaceae bacterium]|jgi:MFS family permease|nr:MFS transporter [Lactobacillaceae bacterium]
MDVLKSKFNAVRAIVSPLSAFFIGTGLTCCAYALMTSVSSLRLEAMGVPTSKAGLVLSLYYLGYVLASLKAYRIINKVGHIRAFTAYVSIFSALSILHFFNSSIFFWGVMRLAEGYCIGAATLCLESWLNTRANNRNRGVVMSLYMVTTYLGSSLAQVMLNIPDKGEVTFYIIISVLFSIALVPISLTALPTPEISVHESMPLSKLYKKTPVGVVACFVSGFLVGSFYVLGTIFCKKMGLSMAETSMFMFFGVLGGMVAQIPVGRISDKMDRRYVILASSIVLCVLSPIIYFVITKGGWYLGASAFILGASLFVIYPVCVSHINDLVEDKERVQASGRLILLQGSGLIAGPVVVSFFMEHIGNVSFCISLSAITLALIIFIKKHMKIKPDIGYVQVTPTTPIPVSTSAIFEELATDDTAADRVKKVLAKKNKDI